MLHYRLDILYDTSQQMVSKQGSTLLTTLEVGIADLLECD